MSRGAVWFAIQPGYWAVPVIRSTDYKNHNHFVPQNGVQVFLLWLRIWLDWLCGQEYAIGSTQIRKPALVNRRCRRMALRKTPPARSYNILFHLCGKTLSRTQFLELMCVLMPLGRVRIYGMWFRGSALQRRALLICYDHGWWRAPLGEMGRVNGGVWHAHLRPN